MSVININRNKMPDNYLDLEIQVVGRINSNLSEFKLQASLVKTKHFKNDLCREIFLLLKNTARDEVRTYSYEMLEINLANHKDYDEDIIKKIAKVSKEKYSLDEVLTFIYFMKREFVVRNSKRMIDHLIAAKTPEDIEKIAIFLTKLSGFNRTDDGNNWTELRKKGDGLTKTFPTNFEWLEKTIGGYYKGEMNFMYGLPSHGKSTVMLYEISESIRKNKELTAKIFLSEMTAGIFWRRVLNKDFNKNIPIYSSLHDEHWEYLKETYGDRLIIEESLSAEEMCQSMLSYKKDMFAIDSLQYIPRPNTGGTPTAILNELNMLQMAISNTSSSMIIVSHVAVSKVMEIINTKKAKEDVKKLFEYCMPTDDMMEWSSACSKLGRRNISVMRPFKFTDRPSDAHRFFMKLTKNSHGESGITKEVFLNPETFKFVEGGKAQVSI